MPSLSGAVLEDNCEVGSNMPSTTVLEYYTFMSLDPHMYLERFKFLIYKWGPQYEINYEYLSPFSQITRSLGFS